MLCTNSFFGFCDDPSSTIIFLTERLGFSLIVMYRSTGIGAIGVGNGRGNEHGVL